MNHPNHKHRTFISVSGEAEDFGLIDLVDCVLLSTEQASSIISQMETQFLGDRDSVSDADNVATLAVIKKELLDIETVVQWHFNNSKEVKNDD